VLAKAAYTALADVRLETPGAAETAEQMIGVAKIQGPTFYQARDQFLSAARHDLNDCSARRL
jgi:hypothetical protein